MSGLQNYGDGGVFLSVADGKLVRSFKEKNDNTEERITKTGKLVHEQKFDFIVGKFTDLKTRENEYGKQYILTVIAEGKKFLLNISYSSRYATSLLKCLPNLDIEKEVKLQPWAMIDKNDPTKKVTGITLWQDGEKIAPLYTRDTPHGLPQMVQVKLKGKMVWDSTDMDAFLENASMKLFKNEPAKPVKWEENWASKINDKEKFTTVTLKKTEQDDDGFIGIDGEAKF